MKFNSTEQNVIWFRDRYNAAELVLKPPYQRKPVWSARQKCALIESILLGLPIPELYIQHTVEDVEGEDKSMYALVDGQQRIRTVLQFLGIDKSESELESNAFRLDKLAAGSKYKDKSLTTLDPADRANFLKYKFSVRNIDTSSDDEVREIFKRINKYVTKLNDQELRNATFTGPFMVLSNQLADDEYWVDHKLVSPAQIRRMKDVEFVSELLIAVLHGPQGGSAATISDYYVQYEDYDEEFPAQRQVVERFHKTLKAIGSILTGGAFTRFKNNRTDFYSLFTAISYLFLNEKSFSKAAVPKARTALLTFESKVNRALADETYRPAVDISTYARAAEKGVNDKKRRSDRHAVLVKLLDPFFV